MIPREKCCCFTGHRPEKLPWHENEDDPRCRVCKETMVKELELAYKLGYHHFISGMARGTDLYFCEAVLLLQKNTPTSRWKPPSLSPTNRQAGRQQTRSASLTPGTV